MKTHCKNNHEFTSENTYIRPDTKTRQCRACSKAQDKTKWRKRRLPQLEKVCAECGKVFTTAKKQQKYCVRTCTLNAASARQKAKVQDKPNYSEQYQRRKSSEMVRKYGITLDYWTEYIKALSGCELCGRDRKLVVDHCHVTGKFRGAICQGCNVAIGNLGDTVEGVLKAVKYLS